MPLTKIPTSMLADTFATQANIDAAIAAEVTARNAAIAEIPTPTVPVALNYQVFNASGTWTKPSGYGTNALAKIQVWGGGGGGSKNSNNGGGGGGGFNERWVLLSSLAATVTVTIGAGGTSTATAGGAGGIGGNSTFGTHVTGYGGSGGSISGGGGGGGPFGAGSFTTPGLPAIVAGFDAMPTPTLVYLSGQGMPGNSSGQDGVEHGGGGGAGSTRTGGRSVHGGGGGGGVGGAGGASVNGGNGGAGVASGNGIAGTQPGGGGGATTSGTSGVGGAGRVIVTVFDGT